MTATSQAGPGTTRPRAQIHDEFSHIIWTNFSGTDSSYRDPAGLLDENAGRFLNVGTLRGTGGLEITAGASAPLVGNPRRIDRGSIPALQIRPADVIVLSPDW